MELDKIAARLRPRSPYEATDLGFVLVRHLWRALLPAWVMGVAPFFIAGALLASFTPLFWLSLVALWWLKPLYDRIALFVLGRGFFGDAPAPRKTLGHLWRATFSLGTLADLTWRRFNPYRSSVMPVRELEQLRGDAARQRLKTLMRHDIQTPSLMLVCVAWMVEWILWVAAIMLLLMAMPGAAGVDLPGQFDILLSGEGGAVGLKLYILIAYFICMSLVEVVYVAAGFGLYINRRVGLEGWDIELVFRRLARRLRTGSPGENAREAGNSRGGGKTIAAVLLAMVLSGFAAPEPAWADDAPAGVEAVESPAAEQDEFDPQVEIASILKSPEFGEEKQESTWRLRPDLFEPSESEDPEFLARIAGLIARFGELFLWVFVGCLLMGALYFLRKYMRPPGAKDSAKTPEKAAETAYIPVEDAPRMVLPDDIVEAAMAAWHAGDHAQGLSLLYRGTIRGLARGYRIEIDPGMTARQSIQRVREAGGPADYLSELAGAWTQVVYAGRDIADERAERLFSAWKRHFSGTEEAR